MQNNRKSAIISWVFLSAVAGGAGAAEYQIDPAHSEVIFKVRHMGISTVTGRFDKFTGSFDVDPKNVKGTKGNAVIEAASISTGNEKRDAHLRNADFFDVEKNPHIKFSGKEVRDVNMADSTATLVGDLTMHGVTKEIQLKVKGGGIIQDGWGNDRAAFTANGKINRYDYGLKWNKALETGGMVVSETVELVLAFEGVRPSAKASEAKSPTALAAAAKDAKTPKVAEAEESKKK
jgi:polyisoprenoid-binding protein YceI